MPDQTQLPTNDRAGEGGAAEIVCEEVSKQFENATRPAVDRVSLTVAAGSVVVLLGPSGCGKTTLLKMVNRLYEPTGGKIRIGGIEVHDLPATELRRGIGYQIQQVGLFPHMNIAMNISVVPRLLGWDKEKIARRSEYLLDMVGLPREYLPRYPRQLSGGEQQRVGLARALAADPSILLMDEPFAAIDAINRACLQDELNEIHRKVKKTILFVTHDVEEAFRLAEKIVIMKEGHLVQYGTPLEIVTRPCDAFVEELVGTQNMLRRLSLLNVQAVLDARRGGKTAAAPPASAASAGGLASLPEGSPRVHAADDLRSALSLLLDSGTEAVPVVDYQERPIDLLTFADLKAALAAQTAGARAPAA
jgi:osmoprotectant transport system ATP-binding protein